MNGWVSTWNARCGIATYSANILEHLSGDYEIFAARDDSLLGEDGENVHRCWEKGSGNFDGLVSSVIQKEVSKVVIQHHPGQILFRDLNALILELTGLGVKVSVTLHNTKERPLIFRANRVDRAVMGLKRCANVFVHSKGDVSRLAGMGVSENVSHIPHGIYPAPVEEGAIDVPEGRVMGAFGFLMPHKGFPQLIEGFSMLSEWDYLVMFCSDRGDSGGALNECLDTIDRCKVGNKVILDTDSHPQEDLISALSNCELVVFPYQKTKESASGAVRMAIAAGTAVAVTPLEIFSDIDDAIVLEGITAEKIASSLSLIGAEELEKSSNGIRRIRKAYQWSKVASMIDVCLTE